MGSNKMRTAHPVASRRLLLAGLAGVAIGASVLAGATVAQARTDTISAWSVGHRSATWSDGNTTSADTKIRLTSVSIAQAGSPFSYTPSSVQLQLLRDVPPIGWQSQGNRTAAPGSYHNWGDVVSGSYRYQYNGATEGGTFHGAGSGFDLFATATVTW